MWFSFRSIVVAASSQPSTSSAPSNAMPCPPTRTTTSGSENDASIAISGIAFLHAKLLTIHTSRKVLTKTGLEQPLLTYIHYIYTYIYIHGRPYIRFGLKGDYNHGTAESTFMYHVVPTVQLFRTERKRKLMRLILHGAPRTRVLYLLAYI